MSENNENKNPAVVNEISEPVSDLSIYDMEKIQKYVDDGLPGLANIDDTQMFRIMEAYLSGKTYSQISKAMQIQRVIITYLSNKFDWYSMRRDVLSELEGTMRMRILEKRIISQDFMLSMAHMYETKIGNKIDRYIATGDESHVNQIDLKEVDKYFKIVDFIHKVGEPKTPKGEKVPAVGLNLGEGVTVEKMDDGKIEITPKQHIIKNRLKEFAELRRKEAVAKNNVEKDEE